MKKLTQMILLAGLLCALAGMPVFSASAKSADPDPNANPVLAQFIKSGAKIYYLGKSAGLDGWFVYKDNQVQMGYTTSDQKNIIFGVMLDKDGQSVSSLQIKSLYDTNPEVSQLLSSLGNQMPPQAASTLPGQVMPDGTMVPSMPGAMAAPAAMPAPSLPSPLALSPGERLIQTLQMAAGVNVGAASAPQLMMVADPNCPHCQATWKALRDSVFGSKLQIRLVPIGAVDPDSERAAAQLLGSINPLEAWDKYIGGDQNQLAGTPDAMRLQAVRNNHLLIDAWHIQMTPYIVYRAKDGRVKIVQGEPQQAAAIVNDIAP